MSGEAVDFPWIALVGHYIDTKFYVAVDFLLQLTVRDKICCMKVSNICKLYCALCGGVSIYLSISYLKKRLWKYGLSLFLIILHSCEIMSVHDSFFPIRSDFFLLNPDFFLVASFSYVLKISFCCILTPSLTDRILIAFFLSAS